MIKLLLKSVREYTKYSILAPLTVVIETLFFALIPALLARLIDEGIVIENMTAVYKVGFKIILVSIFMTFFGILGGFFAAKASGGFAKNLRHDIFYKMQNFSFFNIDKFNTSSLVVRLTTDVQRLQMSFQMLIRLAFKAPFSLIFSCYMAFSLNVQLAMIFLYVIPIIVVILFVIIKLAMPRFEKVYNEYDNLNEIVKENLDGIKVVKAYVREEQQNKKFMTETNFIKALYKSAYGLPIIAQPLMLLIVYGASALIIWFGSRMVIEGDLSTGDLFGLVSYISMALFSLIMLSMVFVMVSVSMASAKRVVEVLKEEPNIVNSKNPLSVINSGSIMYRHVNFSYSNRKDKRVLKDININISTGNRVGIIGGTGSSKSTLVYLLPRFYDVLSGEIEIDGINIKNIDLKTLRNSISFVLQKSVLFSGTIMDNLKWGNKHASKEQVVKACKIAQADGFIRSFEQGYNHLLEQGGKNISGGQRQRLAIARALLKNPKIIIFDDSTSAVDMATEALIRKNLIKNIPGLTQLIIAQRIISVKDCDTILVMNDGKIVGKGTHDELLVNNQIYKEVYISQIKENV